MKYLLIPLLVLLAACNRVPEQPVVMESTYNQMITYERRCSNNIVVYVIFESDVEIGRIGAVSPDGLDIPCNLPQESILERSNVGLYRAAQ